MLKSVADAVSHFKRNWTSVLSRSGIEDVCQEVGLKWRDRVLTPAHTFELFLLQVLHGNTAITHLRMFSSQSFTASAYCQARMKLPLQVFETLLEPFGTDTLLETNSSNVRLVRGDSSSAGVHANH